MVASANSLILSVHLISHFLPAFLSFFSSFSSFLLSFLPFPHTPGFLLPGAALYLKRAPSAQVILAAAGERSDKSLMVEKRVCGTLGTHRWCQLIHRKKGKMKEWGVGEGVENRGQNYKAKIGEEGKIKNRVATLRTNVAIAWKRER